MESLGHRQRLPKQEGAPPLHPHGSHAFAATSQLSTGPLVLKQAFLQDSTLPGVEGAGDKVQDLLPASFFG